MKRRSQLLDLLLVLNQPARDVILQKFSEGLGLFRVCNLQLIILDLEVSGVLLESLKFSLREIFLLGERLDLALELGIHALGLQEGGLFLN